MTAIHKQLLRVPKDVADAAKQIAKDDDRSFNSLIVKLLKKEVAEHKKTA
jgi:hypothetical protein